MSNIENQYLLILSRLINAEKYPNRTGVAAHKIVPQMLQHDMSEGFPILTTKKIAWKTLKVELEGFINGVTSKKWYQDRVCHIWDAWCNPQKVPYGNDEETKAKMAAEDDLGPTIYGASWRGFHDPLCDGQKIDQFKNVVDTLKKNPQDRRAICLAFNPLGQAHTSLCACHVLFQVTTRGEYLDLTWYQRSVDVFLGLPFNLTSYGLLLHLLAKESGLKEGVLTGFLSDVHLYENHIEQATEQLGRDMLPLPKIETPDFTSIFDWNHTQSKLIGYQSHEPIKAPVAV